MKRRSMEETDAVDRSAGELSPQEEEEEKKKKKKKRSGGEEVKEAVAADLGEDLAFEVLKRADARTLAVAACVSRGWRRLAEDERLWEAVCTPHWASIGCGNGQLRSVVLALGGFRRLHSLYMVPLRPSARPTPPPALPVPFPSATRRPPQLPARWGKDEVQLSLSLLSIGYFEKMNFGYKRGGGGSG